MVLLGPLLPSERSDSAGAGGVENRSRLHEVLTHINQDGFWGSIVENPQVLLVNAPDDHCKVAVRIRNDNLPVL